MYLKKYNLTFIQKKDFLKKIDLDKVFYKLFLLSRSLPKAQIKLEPSSTLILKTNLYFLVKQFVYLKLLLQMFGSNSTGYYYELDRLCLKLQNSNLYTSDIELDKRRKAENLFFFLKNFDNPILARLESSYFTKDDLDKTLSSFLRTYHNYDASFYFNKTQHTELVTKFLKLKRFYNTINEARFNSTLSLYKKRYNLYSSGFKIKVQSLLNLYSNSFSRYSKVKYFSSKSYHKLVWRRRKRKKWRRSILARFFRSRHRLYHKFYIPRHFEVNYKTLGLVYHDFKDIRTLNSKLSFWLNLRRLYTFILR